MTVTEQRSGTGRSGQHAAPASRQRFIDAALDLFVENGFNGTSLQMIGDRLEVSKAAVAYHFGSKDDLLAAVVEPAFVDLEALMARAESARRESERRTQALVGYVDYLIQHRRVSFWLARDVAALSHPAVAEMLGSFVARMDTLLVGSDDTRARIWGSAIFQALNGPIVIAAEASDEELRAELERIGRHMIRGYQSSRRDAQASATDTAARP